MRSGFLGALRAQILQCVGAGGWLSERCMHAPAPTARPEGHHQSHPGARPAAKTAVLLLPPLLLHCFCHR
eukprot:COSAG01_NODE_7447_length_3208_cov_5.409135_1_plen_70_part_00